MSRLNILALAGAVTLPLVGWPGETFAATAHNSQAGAYGSTKNACAPTPGFPDDDECLSGAIRDYVDGEPLPTSRRDRHRPARPALDWPE